MIKMLPVAFIVNLLCLINPLETLQAIKSSSMFTTSTIVQPSIVGLTPNISGYYNHNPEYEFAPIKDNQTGKLNLVGNKRTPVNNQLQQQIGKVNYQQSKDVTNQVNSLRSATRFAINDKQQQGLGHLNVLGLQSDFQNQLLPLSFSSSQSAKYREVEEVSPTNEVDQDSREPEISRQPEVPRGDGEGPVIPPHEPESAPIDPNTPGYAGPPQPPGLSPGQPSFPVPPSPEFPRTFPSPPNSAPQTPSFPPNLFPPQRPGIVVPSFPPTAESDAESQPPPVSSYPPASIVPNASPLYPNTFHLLPEQPLQPPSIQFPVAPSPPPQAPVYPSYSPPSWLTSFYTPSTNFYSSSPNNEGIISAYAHLFPTLKSSYLIPRSLIPVGSQLATVAHYLSSSVPNLATHLNPLYLNQDGDQQTHLIPDNNQEPQLINVNPVVNLHSPPVKEGETTGFSNITTTTESSVEGLKGSDEEDAERISNI